VYYVEALLDDSGDRAIRAVWKALSVAGLPSQQDHGGESNRPHVTLTVVTDWPDDLDLSPVGGLPLTVPLGPVSIFGPRRFTLVRSLVVSESLLAVRRDVAGRLGPPASSFYADGRWVPHLTLTSRLQPDRLGAAIEVSADLVLDSVELTSVRRWDSDARVVSAFP